MIGEFENLQHEIQQKKMELEFLESRLDSLRKIMDERKSGSLVDMHIDPDKRNWEYDGDGRRIPRKIS
jgi:SMC interacting uncharacterized protein involved in chromosome segregation